MNPKQLENAIKNLGIKRVINFNGTELRLACLLREEDRRPFRTAGGVTMGTVYTVSEFSLGPYLLSNTQIAVLDFTMKPGVDGLLGMNVLGQFRFQIDQENARLLLSKE